MAREIFRKAALDRMASPERTDHPVRLVRPSGWLLLCGFLIAVVAGTGWAFRTSAPIKVNAQGILIDQGGLVEISSEQGGLIQDIRLSPGAVVAAGQIVAVLSRSELRRELASSKATLGDLQNRYDRLQEAHLARAQRERASDETRTATIIQTRRALLERLTLLEGRVAKLEPLAQRKVVPELRLIEARIAVSDLRERLLSLEEEEQKLILDAAETLSQRDFELLEERLALEEQARKIARLTAQLSEERVVRSSHNGQVVEIKVNPGDVLTPGTALATLAPVASERNLQALMYVPPADGKRIQPGMSAEIAPTTVEREVYGHIQATVLSVAPLPATPEGMRRVLQNDQLVQQLSRNGAPIEVRLSLDRDAETPTGFRWSSSAGPVGGVNAGTMLDGDVVIEERPLIDLVLPGASQTLGRGRP